MPGSPHFIRSPCFIQSAVQFGQYKTQTKPSGYEEMKNPDEKVNIGAVEAKTLYLGRGGWGGLLTYNQN